MFNTTLNRPLIIIAFVSGGREAKRTWQREVPRMVLMRMRMRMMWMMTMMMTMRGGGRLARHLQAILNSD